MQLKEEAEEEIHIAHCKFVDGLPAHETYMEEKMNNSGYYDKIVTAAWTLDRKNNVLTYGATIFRKADNRDHWVKADHRNKAIERYKNCPVVVKLINLDKYATINDRAIDWYIARNLVLSVGAYTKNTKEERMTEAVLGTEDGQILITSLKTLPTNFNFRYDPNLRFNLPERSDDDNNKMGTYYSDPFTDDVWFALFGGTIAGLAFYFAISTI